MCCDESLCPKTAEQLLIWLPWQFSSLWRKFSYSGQVYFWQPTLSKLARTLLFIVFEQFVPAVKRLHSLNSRTDEWQKENRRGWELWGKAQQGRVGSWGMEYRCNKKRPRELCCTKDAALVILVLSQRLAVQQHDVSLPLLVSHCHSLLSLPYQRWGGASVPDR